MMLAVFGPAARAHRSSAPDRNLDRPHRSSPFASNCDDGINAGARKARHMIDALKRLIRLFGKCERQRNNPGDTGRCPHQ